MYVAVFVIAYLCACDAYSVPPDKVPASHIIKTRSIDLNNAHGLAMEVRLEKVVEPTGYHLKLEPYLEDGLFKGLVKINVTWLKDADEINIHCAHELEITESHVHLLLSGSKEKQKIKVKKMMMDAKKPIATLYLERAVPKSSTGVLELSFNGNLETATTEAFFKTTYMTDQEFERIVAGTQLRANNARRMFPCFDEPNYKAPFDISVVRPRDMIALSNMPVKKTEDITDEPDAVWDHFERTPPMSTFTLGLVVADLKELGSSTDYRDDNGNDIELRVWGRPEYLPALEGLTEKLVRVFGEIANVWRVPLPLRKLDVVALPNYQGVKPADNWGLIVFKESDLSSRGYLQLAQELSYQWLGAFTTPAWWSDAHLNKALVGYIAAETAFKINNGSEMEGKWPMTVLYSLYYEFSKRYPHSRITGMKQETASTKIELLFRMFNYTIGGDTFKKGLQMFLEAHKFKTFTGSDIWEALSKAAVEDGKVSSDMDLKVVANSWIDKDRLPLVTVEKKPSDNSIVVTQKVYLRERPHDVPDADRMSWWIPLVVVQEDKLNFTNTMPVIWMNTKDLIINNISEKSLFVLVNPEEIGPFPVNYDRQTWEQISEYLRSPQRTKIPELTRAKLLHDAWNLAYAGELSFATALNMTLFLKNERHPLVWDPVFTMIDHLGRRLCVCMENKFKVYVRYLLIPLYEELSKDVKDDEETWRKNLRSMTKTFLCSAGYKPCVKEAQKQFAKWMEAKTPDEGNPCHAGLNKYLSTLRFKDPISLDGGNTLAGGLFPRLMTGISNQYICPVFKYGSMKEWEFGLERVINFPPSRKQSERTYLLKTLAGCPAEDMKVERLLNVTLLEENANFTETDLFLIFNMLSGNIHGYPLLLEFMWAHWDVLKERFSSRTNLWDSMINAATSSFKTQSGLESVTNLYKIHHGEFGSAEHIIEKSMRNIREEAKWSTENFPVVDEWLQAFFRNEDLICKCDLCGLCCRNEYCTDCDATQCDCNLR